MLCIFTHSCYESNLISNIDFLVKQLHCITFENHANTLTFKLPIIVFPHTLIEYEELFDTRCYLTPFCLDLLSSYTLRWLIFLSDINTTNQFQFIDSVYMYNLYIGTCFTSFVLCLSKWCLYLLSWTWFIDSCTIEAESIATVNVSESSKYVQHSII